MTLRLLAFSFGNDSAFEGQLVGALERLEIGGEGRVRDGLFVAREPDTGKLSAVCLSDIPPSRTTSRLLDFRLTDRARAAATEQAIAGPAGEAVSALGARLEPGMAIAVLLVQHRSEFALDPLADAVARLGGSELIDEPVDASRIADVTTRLVAATA